MLRHALAHSKSGDRLDERWAVLIDRTGLNVSCRHDRLLQLEQTLLELELPEPEWEQELLDELLVDDREPPVSISKAAISFSGSCSCVSLF